ncbi:putative thiamine transporter SLC35F3 isoform X2 [Paramacrobiotus metropolitanus]|uniref:putative thiamine transporter SLC35F3 isoform X2 n=1 Tax=Paramacrobiotus metropolitanus TaxID=2943436 RepID=UPI002445A889|nr:putative thiamine transporter SLC35F3 isoform X2 [Paramacrobiotus metropolitanus]
MDYNYSYFALLPNQPTESPSADELAKLARLPRRKPKEPDGFCNRKLGYGVILVVVVSITWVSATQFTRATLTSTGHFFAPFFLIWFNTSWMILCYPMYYAVNWINCKCQNRDYRPSINAAWKIFGAESFSGWTAAFRCGCFAIIWAATNYMYSYALSILAASDVSALFSSNTAFVFFFSWTILHERFEGTKLFASIFSLAGIIIMSYVDGFLWDNPALSGILLAVGSAVGSAMYKVLFKRLIGDANYGQVSLLLTGLGIFNLILFWPITLTLQLTGVEKWNFSTIPWMYVGGSAALGFLFNALVNYGIALTHPLFITLGVALGLPLNAVVDHFFNKVEFRAIEITGFVLITIGFFMTLLPINWTQSVRKRLPCKRLRKDPDEEALKNHYVHTPRDLLRMSMAAAKKKQQT